jgi:sucrose phosphorylase
MNINYLDATRPDRMDEPVALTARRFLATQSVLLMMRGVPGIYYHSLLGSQNWVEGMLETGQNRSINREKLNFSRLINELQNRATLRFHVFEGYKKLLTIRRQESAFDPHGEQIILDTPVSVFGVYRRARQAERGFFCLTNFSAETCDFDLHTGNVEENMVDQYCDLLSGKTFQLSKKGIHLVMEPYQILWLKGL